VDGEWGVGGVIGSVFDAVVLSDMIGGLSDYE
jgi:hypothetical protein